MAYKKKKGVRKRRRKPQKGGFLPAIGAAIIAGILSKGLFRKKKR